ncbi:5'-3' exoribonuclease 2-like, partial [Notothenia coriiceps]|uniref:5'-3' exoribonuclease 2-like n=1 Tax=Notothenia coriiceps TaxID=8208 RepID=A0A6I9PEL4_9TELE
LLFVFKCFFFTQDSSIIDFYPDDFAIDLNGKKYAWQGVALLPFVDERRLWAALADVYPDLTTEEQRRNSLGSDLMFVGKSHPLFDFIHELYRTESNEVTTTHVKSNQSDRVVPSLEVIIVGCKKL